MIPNRWLHSLYDAKDVLDDLIYGGYFKQLEQLSELCIETLKKDRTIFICGNGGSHADAMHFAEELTGRFRNDRKPLSAMALGSNAAHITCVGNDYGFDKIFVREFEAFSRIGDLVILLSTSGNSKNLIEVLALAKEREIASVALLGKDGGSLKYAGLPIIVPGETSDRIQELHMLILHILVETIEANI